MKLLALGAVLGFVPAAVSDSPPQASSGGLLVAILVALLTGGAGATLFSVYRYGKQGKQERDQLIGDASRAAVEAAKAMLDEYRAELDRAKAAIAELQAKLAESNERIAKLEQDLKKSEADRERLTVALAAAIQRREHQERELRDMRDRVAQLEQIVDGPADAPG